MEGVTKRSVRISETKLVHRLKNKFIPNPEVFEKLKNKSLSERIRKIALAFRERSYKLGNKHVTKFSYVQVSS
jgi:hypothetical protein